MINTKNKHLSKAERNIIEKELNNRSSFRAIARELGRAPTTVANEVKNRCIYKKVGAYGRCFNDCANKTDCYVDSLCDNPKCRHKRCRNCVDCSKYCELYVKTTCNDLTRAPYVCNGCDNRNKCTLEKKLYTAKDSHEEYKYILSDTREGLSISEDELLNINDIVSEKIVKGQSFHHIHTNHSDELLISERSLYRYLELGFLDVKNIDLPRKIRFSKRVKSKKKFKVDKGCRINRNYDDFLEFTKNNPDSPVVEIDSVESIKGGKVLLTIHFRVPKLMLAFIRDRNDSRSVSNVFNLLQETLGADTFALIFPIILTDNGSEFSNPKEMEFHNNNRVSNVFYCDPGASFQKGACENNHTFIRRIIPKGKSMDSLTQLDINNMMNHINSYNRKDLGNKSPYYIFKELYGIDILNKLKVNIIPTDDINLTPKLFK